MLTKESNLSYEIVRYCAPTLAGIKSASLFNIQKSNNNNIYDEIKKINEYISNQGVKVIPLYEKNDRVLIYVFRPDFLKKELVNDLTKSILLKKGYQSNNLNECLSTLRNKLINNSEYPHEIGLFLGYPPEDVYGFMYNRDNDLKVKGYWRVYKNSNDAKKLFNKFDKCTESLLNKFSNGYSLEDLTVKVN